MPTALITGPSSGIGLELARLIAADGIDLILVARREERLREIAEEFRRLFDVRVDLLVKDLSVAEAPEEIQHWCIGEGRQVDVLVNNAGFGFRDDFLEIPLEKQLDMIRVNVAALTALTHLFLPGMIDRGSGGVLNVASTAGFQPGPHMATYYASKAYVLHFTEALYEELRGTGVRVTCLAPGPTRTEFGEKSDMNRTHLFKHASMPADRVARAGFDAFKRGKPLIVPGVTNRLGVLMSRLLPRFLTRKIIARLQ